MKRKTAILTVSYLCAAIAMLGLFSALQQSRAAGGERDGRYAGEHAFEELCAAANGMDLALQKASLATSPGLETALCADVYARAMAGSGALGSLPFDSQELEKTAAFLGRAGDYARSLAAAAATGAAWSEADREKLEELAQASAWLAGRLEELRSAAADGGESVDAQTALLALEDEFPALPLLVYDGRYSQGEAENVMLAGKPEVSEREACLIAAGFLGKPSQAAVSAGQTDCDAPCWRVEAGDYAVTVSVRGGQVLQAVCARTPGSGGLSAEDARAAAEKFLAAHGYGSVKETGWTLEGGTYVGSWCAVQDGVVCYPDELRVAIALDTGELAGFDATEYVSSHRRRALAEPAASAEDARAALLPSLTVEDEYLAVAASAGGEERLCRVFVCRREDGTRCAVFASAATGSQERIVLLREDETGARML